MRAWKRALSVPAMACAVALAGCGTNERDQVKAKVSQFITATAHKNYTTLCDQVLAPALLGHLSAYGIKCERAMALALGKLQNPSLAIGNVTVKGNNASVTVITTASGQEGVLTAIELVNTSKGWRVINLGAPQFPGRTARPRGTTGA